MSRGFLRPCTGLASQPLARILHTDSLGFGGDYSTAGTGRVCFFHFIVHEFLLMKLTARCDLPLPTAYADFGK